MKKKQTSFIGFGLMRTNIEIRGYSISIKFVETCKGRRFIREMSLRYVVEKEKSDADIPDWGLSPG